MDTMILQIEQIAQAQEIQKMSSSETLLSSICNTYISCGTWIVLRYFKTQILTKRAESVCEGKLLGDFFS